MTALALHVASKLPPAEGWIAQAPCANGSPYDHDLPVGLRGHRMMRHNVLADYTVRQALSRCASCPFTQRCIERVAPTTSYYDGVCGGNAGKIHRTYAWVSRG